MLALDRPAEPRSPPHDAVRRPLVVFEKVGKTFAGQRGTAAVSALAEVSLDVAEGEIYGVIGPSGAGKSTLIRLVNGLERPTHGRVVVDGQEMAGLTAAPLRAARRRIGMIFQHFNLLSSRTAFGNVALPLELEGLSRDAIRRRVDPLLELVDLVDKRDRYPAELSGGQKQRVAIARALACRPKVLLSDEATSALDPETTRSILRLLASINRELGLTVLLITHEMQVIKQACHRVGVLDRGRLVEEGSVTDVFASPRTEVARSLVAAAIGSMLPAWIERRLRAEPVPGGSAIARIVLRGPAAVEPVIARLAREERIEAAIVGGQIDELGGAPFGLLTVRLPSEEATLGRARSFLLRHGFSFEVLGHVAADR